MQEVTRKLGKMNVNIFYYIIAREVINCIGKNSFSGKRDRS